MSSRIKERITRNMTKIVKGMKLESTLIIHIYKKKLLTADEFETLTQNCQPQKMNLQVLRLLNTKGPTAHLIFAKCLKAENTHRTHQELFDLIFGEEARLEVQGELLMIKAYFQTMKKVRQHHSQGEWEAVDELIKNSVDRRSTEFHVALLLESCTGFIIQMNKAKVLRTVAKAKELCSNIDNNCKTFLFGRCECILAMMYLFSAETDKALECIMEARHLQYNIQAGEDTALTNYCHGCILLELVSKQADPDIEREAKMNLEIALEHIIDGGDDFGIDPALSQIRLAQLYLGSSMYLPGRKTDINSLRSAEQLLEAVARNLSPASALRTQCLYYYTESDLCRICGDLERARSSACKALGIAVANGFIADIKSANARLNACLFTC